MHRFFISPDQIRGLLVRFDDDQAHQMRRVLRLRPGERVLALDGQGMQFEVTLEEVSNGRVTGLVAAQTAATGEPRIRLTLFQSLLQRDKFEWVLQKGTEIGVAAFVPVITRRSLVRDADDVGENKLERWRRIIREAAEQSGRGALPTIGAAVPLAAALAGLPSPQPSPVGRGSEAPSPQPSPAGRGSAAPSPQPSPTGRGSAEPSPTERGGSGSLPLGGRVRERAIIAWEGEPDRTLRQALGETDNVTDIALFIGPEGGYEAAEVEDAAAHGVAAFTLGRRILRTETAAVVGAALVLYELGEMGTA